jgi:hypothetical protein
MERYLSIPLYEIKKRGSKHPFPEASSGDVRIFVYLDTMSTRMAFNASWLNGTSRMAPATCVSERRPDSDDHWQDEQA